MLALCILRNQVRSKLNGRASWHSIIINDTHTQNADQSFDKLNPLIEIATQPDFDHY